MGGAVNGDQQITFLWVIRHPRQVFDVHLQVARLIFRSGFRRWLFLLIRLFRDERTQVIHACRVSSRSRDERTMLGFKHSRTTTKRSSRGNSSVRLSRTTISSCRGERAVCRRCGRWGRSSIESRLRHF